MDLNILRTDSETEARFAEIHAIDMRMWLVLAKYAGREMPPDAQIRHAELYDRLSELRKQVGTWD